MAKTLFECLMCAHCYWGQEDCPRCGYYLRVVLCCLDVASDLPTPPPKAKINQDT